MRSVSTTMRSVSIASSRTVARVTTPVSPMPPAVAQKTSGSLGGRHGPRPASGRRGASGRTCSQNAAVAVVVLAVDVRGDRPADRHLARPGRHRDEPALRAPRPRAARRSTRPPRPSTSPLAASIGADAAEPAVVDDRPAGDLRGVPVRATEPPGDHRAAGLGEDRRDVVLVRGGDEPRRRRAGSAPIPTARSRVDPDHDEIAQHAPSAWTVRSLQHEVLGCAATPGIELEQDVQHRRARRARPTAGSRPGRGARRAAVAVDGRTPRGSSAVTVTAAHRVSAERRKASV